MFIFDISNILNLLLMIIATVLLIYLAQELKKSYIAGIVLFFYLAILIMHAVQLVRLPEEYAQMLPVLARCVAIDFGFIFVSFFAYLWVDDIEAKKMNKKAFLIMSYTLCAIFLIDELYNLIFARLFSLPRASTIYKKLGLRYLYFN